MGTVRMAARKTRTESRSHSHVSDGQRRQRRWRAPPPQAAALPLSLSTRERARTSPGCTHRTRPRIGRSRPGLRLLCQKCRGSGRRRRALAGADACRREQVAGKGGLVRAVGIMPHPGLRWRTPGCGSCRAFARNESHTHTHTHTWKRLATSWMNAPPGDGHDSDSVQSRGGEETRGQQ